MNKFQHSAHPVLLIGERRVAHYFHTARITCGCMWKSVNINSKKSTVKSRVALHST